MQLHPAPAAHSKTSNTCCNLSTLSSHVTPSSHSATAASITGTSCSSTSYINKAALFTTTVDHDVNTWHRKLGHPSASTFTQILKLLPAATHKSKLLFCDACNQGKLQQVPHISQSVKTSKPFQLIHSDLWGPAFTPSAYGYKLTSITYTSLMILLAILGFTL